MTLRLASSPAAIAAIDDDFGLAVGEAARLIGCDASTVRKLLRRGELAGHRVGLGAKRKGVRVSHASVQGYKARNRIAPAAAPDLKPQRVASAAHREAVASLAALGLRF